MRELRPLTLDSSVFISKIKGSEKYSDHCGNIISRVGTDFVLIEPAILLAEVANAVGRNIDLRTARQEADTLTSMIAVLIPCNSEFCLRVLM